MKRSAQIRLVLLGGLTAGTFGDCTTASAAQGGALPLQQDAVYGNDHQASYAGFYHAPYQGWYRLPYNHYDPQRKLYFHGGNWTPEPHQSIVNLSEPRTDALQAALLAWQQQQQQGTIRRSGFGTTSHSHFTSS